MRLFFAAALCLLLPVAAMAQTQAPSYKTAQMEQRMAKRFAAADTDHDGKLTLKEAQAGMPRLAEHFDAVDTDKKGYVTLDQLKQFMASRGMHP